MSRQIHKAYPLTTTWARIEAGDIARRGVLFQNQSRNAVNILIAQGEQADTYAAIELIPTGALYEDILPPSGDIWARTSTGAATLTLVLKY